MGTKSTQIADRLFSHNRGTALIDFSTAEIVTMPHGYQRGVDQDHVNKLVEEFANKGIFGRDSAHLKGILLDDDGNRSGVLKGARLHLFAGQHRAMATQAAYRDDRIPQESTVWMVSLYAMSARFTWSSRCHLTRLGSDSRLSRSS
jgi:hypothetical protein